MPEEAAAVLTKAPHRTPAQPWPPTDRFIYRFFEFVMLYGPVFKDVAHEMFGDGIMAPSTCPWTSRKWKTRQACRGW